MIYDLYNCLQFFVLVSYHFGCTLPFSFLLLYFSLCLCYAILPFLNLIFCCSLFALFYISRLITKGKEEGIANHSRLLLLSTVTVRVENNTSCSGIVWYPKERGTFIRPLTWFLLCHGCDLWVIVVLVTVPNLVLNYGHNSCP